MNWSRAHQKFGNSYLHSFTLLSCLKIFGSNGIAKFGSPERRRLLALCTVEQYSILIARYASECETLLTSPCTLAFSDKELFSTSSELEARSKAASISSSGKMGVSRKVSRAGNSVERT